MAAEEGALLGTTFLQILPDVSKLKPALTDAEQSAQKSGKKIEQSIAGSGNAVARALANVQAAQEKAEGAISQGSTRSRTYVARLAGAIEQLNAAITETKASGEALTAEQVKGYATSRAALQKLTVETRELSRVQTLTKNATMEGGLAFRNAEGALTALNPQVGNFAAKATILALVLREVKEVIFSAMPHDVMENSWLGTVEHFGWDNVRHRIELYGDALTQVYERTKGFITGGREGYEAAKKGQEGDLLGAIARAHGRKAGESLFFGPGFPGTAHADSAGLAETQALLRTQRERILQLDLENAKLGGNVAAIHAVEAALDDLNRQDLIAAGYDRENVDRIIAKTKANRDYAEALKILHDKVEISIADAQRQIPKTTAAMFSAIPLPFPQQFNVLHSLPTPEHMPDFGDVAAKVLSQYQSTWGEIEQITQSAATTLEGSLSDGFFSALTGNIDGMKSAFKGLLQSFLKDITSFLAQQAVKTLLSYFLTDSAMGYSAGTTSGNIVSSFIGGHADGGVLQGGWTPFANGGVVTRPTLGLVGEGRYNEAVVPLPDGSRIPVDLRGAGAGEQHIYLHMGMEPGLIAKVIDGGAAAGYARVAGDMQYGDLKHHIVRIARQA
jgi:hypothetical protein